ncbi:MAG: hypothetical protein ABSG92_07860 [Conexivisphaerales archaeon]
MNYRLAALLVVLVLVLPVVSVTTHADGAPTILITVTNQVDIDYFGGVTINSAVDFHNNGTSDTGTLPVSLTYGGALTPFVTNMTSNFNVTNVAMGVSTTTYSFDLNSTGAGNDTVLTFTLTLAGMVQEPSPGVRTYNLTNFPDVQVSGGVYSNATAILTLPGGVTPTTNMSQYGYTQLEFPVQYYYEQFYNNTVPQVEYVPVSYPESDLLYFVNNTVTVDNFGWVYIDTLVTINNTGQSGTGTLPLNMTFYGSYQPYLWNESSSVPVSSTQLGNGIESYIFNLPSIVAGGSGQLLFHMKTWGTVNEYTAGTYTYNLTTFPTVDIQGALLYNATSTISLPSGATLSSDLSPYYFVQLPPSNPVYEQIWNTTYIAPSTMVIPVNFTASSPDFNLFQITSLERTIGLAGDGSVLVTDHLSITNYDTQALSEINLTLPASGQYEMREGLVNGGIVDLSAGTITLPVSIAATSMQDFVITYELPRSAVSDNGGTLTINLGAGALNYSQLVQDYSVIFGFPSGTVAQASTPTSFVNQTTMPSVVITAKVPLGWNLYLATPVIVGILIAGLFVFFLYRRRNIQPIEEEGISIVKAKSDVIISLLEQCRLRGEGFSSFEEYSTRRKALEEEKSKVALRLQDFRAKSLKDRSQKALYERIAAEDARLEAIYREGKAALEECIANRLPKGEFEAKIEKLEASAQPLDVLKKPEQKQAQPKPSKSQPKPSK